MTKATEKWLKNIYFIVSINKQEANQNLKADRNFKAATEIAQQREATGERKGEKESVKRERQRERGGRAEVAKQFSTRLSVGLDFFITHTHTHTPEYAHTLTRTHTRNDRENHKILTNLLKVYTLPLDFAGRQKLVP